MFLFEYIMVLTYPSLFWFCYAHTGELTCTLLSSLAGNAIGPSSYESGFLYVLYYIFFSPFSPCTLIMLCIYSLETLFPLHQLLATNRRLHKHSPLNLTCACLCLRVFHTTITLLRLRNLSLSLSH